LHKFRKNASTIFKKSLSQPTSLAKTAHKATEVATPINARTGNQTSPKSLTDASNKQPQALSGLLDTQSKYCTNRTLIPSSKNNKIISGN
jgi:hypothetical protein